MENRDENGEEPLVLEGGIDLGLGGLAPTFYIVLLAIMTALTTVATIAFAIPIPLTSGFFNLGDALVMLSGVVLGPIGGLIAGGVGSAMGDVALGYIHFAPITLVVKGFEGFFVGLLSIRTVRSLNRMSKWDFAGVLIGAFVMLGGYFVSEVFLLGLGVEYAFFELISFNIFQVIAGGIVALLVGPIIRSFLNDTLGTKAS
ncbi:MAG: ECF transporter S component [Candidatus Thorarchaeota archaeon]